MTPNRAARERGFPHYWICDACAAERGGRWPEGHTATMAVRTCGYCGGEKQTLKYIAPWVDYDWPDSKQTRKARLNRD